MLDKEKIISKLREENDTHQLAAIKTALSVHLDRAKLELLASFVMVDATSEDVVVQVAHRQGGLEALEDLTYIINNLLGD